MKKKGIFLVLALIIADVKSIDPLHFLIGTGCIIGSFLTGIQGYKAIEKAIKGDALITHKKKQISVENYKKKKKDKNFSEPYYLRVRYGSPVYWGIATLGLMFVGVIFTKESLEDDIAVTFAAQFSASK